MDWFYDELRVGVVEQTDALVADRAEMIAYAEANDPYPIHLDASTGHLPRVAISSVAVPLEKRLGS